jgi:hypothetical protein
MPLCPQEFGAFLKSKPPSALLASSGCPLNSPFQIENRKLINLSVMIILLELDSQSSTSTSLPVCSSPSIRVKSEPKTSQASGFLFFSLSYWVI